MIYIYCVESFYKFYEDYINSIRLFRGKSKIIFICDENTNLNNYNKENKYIFIKTIPKNIEDFLKDNNEINNIYLINTEQVSKKWWEKYIFTLPKNLKIIDYSYKNMLYYNSQFKTQHIEYKYNPSEILNLKKKRNIAFIGSKSEYRDYILNGINKSVHVSHIHGWGKERDKELFKYKILVNISYNKNYKIFESIRCYRCLFNKMIIISDMKDDIEHLKYKDFIIFVKYDNLINKVIEVYNNYKFYYRKLNLENIKKFINKKDVQLI